MLGGDLSAVVGWGGGALPEKVSSAIMISMVKLILLLGP